MRSLSSVTAMCVDTLNHAQALLACGRMLRLGFFEVVLVTDESVQAFLPAYRSIAERIRIVTIPPIMGRVAYSQFMLNEAVDHVRTDHVLIFQWDGFAISPAHWWPGFLDYDYVGAPWPLSFVNDACLVGNGGFSLRSRKLMNAVRMLEPRFGNLEEDRVICTALGPRLEQEFGVRFAPVEVAKYFSVEHRFETDGRPFTHVSRWGTFGFHAFWNFHLAFTDEELLHTVDTLMLPSVRADMLTRWDAVALLGNLEQQGRFGLRAELARRMAEALGLSDAHTVEPDPVIALVMERAWARARGDVG